METIIVRRTGQVPLRVRGELLAEAASSMESASMAYSGGPGRSQEVKIYCTTSGKYVVALHRSTIWEGEHTTDEAAVFPSLKECVGFLSSRVPGWMLADLIQALGADAVAEDVE